MKLRNGVILCSLIAMAIAVTVVVFACSKQTKEISEDTIKTEKSANMNCTKVYTPLGCCLEVCADCDRDFRDFINLGSTDIPGMEWIIEDCDGNIFPIHFEYIGLASMSDSDIRDPSNWRWARQGNGGFCTCADRIPCDDKPDDIKDAWFSAICTLCPKFCP